MILRSCWARKIFGSTETHRDFLIPTKKLSKLKLIEVLSAEIKEEGYLVDLRDQVSELLVVKKIK